MAKTKATDTEHVPHEDWEEANWPPDHAKCINCGLVIHYDELVPADIASGQPLHAAAKRLGRSCGQ